MLTYWPSLLVPGSPFMLLYMALPDLINGFLEAVGGFFVAFSIIKLHREKIVRGISAVHVGFFSAWGVWNLFYYPHLDQWLSFYGGIVLALTTWVYLGQIIYYNLSDRAPQQCWQNQIDDDAAEAVSLSISAKGLADRPPMEPVKLFRHSDK